MQNYDFVLSFKVKRLLKHSFLLLYSFTSTSGGKILYITGVRRRAKNVEVINPPIITHARGA